jgi:hypothetical protein
MIKVSYEKISINFGKKNFFKVWFSLQFLNPKLEFYLNPNRPLKDEFDPIQRQAYLSVFYTSCTNRNTFT